MPLENQDDEKTYYTEAIKNITMQKEASLRPAFKKSTNQSSDI